jgi:signal transduction histidine kinase
VRRNSLRLRLLGGALIWLSVALVAIALILLHLFRSYAETDFYAELSNDQEQVIAGLGVDADGTLTVTPQISDPQFIKPYSGLYWQVDDAASVMLRSRSLWDFTLSLPVDVVEAGTQHHHRLTGPERQSVLAVERVVELPRYPHPIRVVVAEDARRLDAAVRGFGTTLTMAFVLLGAGLIGAASLQVWVGLRPLERLRARLVRVRDGSAARLEGDFPSEVQPLVDDLNTLLEHQAEVVERGRVMAGNLAHGLKTPLAVIANEANRLEQCGALEAATLIQAQVARMQRQVDFHTARARAAAARAVLGVRCPVAPCVQALLRVIERLHAHRPLVLESAIPEDAVFRGERQDLEEMLGNLLDNAAKWAASRVVVACRRDGSGWLDLSVEDDGPGLTEDQRGEAFARGLRLDDAVPGSGLGLAILRDLAEMYGGEARLVSSPLGGLRAVLKLPAA